MSSLILLISKSVCQYVCVYGYAFRRSLRYRAESWHGGRQIVQECHSATKFTRKNPWPESNTLLGSKFMWGQPELKRLRNALQPPNMANATLEQMILTGARVTTKIIIVVHPRAIIPQLRLNLPVFIGYIDTVINLPTWF